MIEPDHRFDNQLIKPVQERDAKKQAKIQERDAKKQAKIQEREEKKELLIIRKQRVKEIKRNYREQKRITGYCFANHWWNEMSSIERAIYGKN